MVSLLIVFSSHYITGGKSFHRTDIARGYALWYDDGEDEPILQIDYEVKGKIMRKEKETERMLAGQLFSQFEVGKDDWDRVHAAQKAFNESAFWCDSSALEELKKCFGAAPDDLKLTPPVYFDRGVQVFFGKHFYANTDLTILDENDVRFGDRVMVGPHVSIYTVSHPIDPEIRNTELEISAPVTIGDNVWIGGNVVINGGVTIGEGAIIGSGAVVTHDIPAHVVAAGNPCQVIRPIGEADRQFWQAQYEDYLRQFQEFDEKAKP